MNIFLEAHKEVLKVLIEYKVNFMLVGGYAVNYYGYNRLTGDMDLWIKPDNDNKLSLLEAMKSLGFDKERIATIKEWNFEQAQLFSILEKPFQVEFMTHISGIKFNDAEQLVVSAEIDEMMVPVIHFNDLIANKLISGRTKDVADVEHLRKIRNFRKK